MYKRFKVTLENGITPSLIREGKSAFEENCEIVKESLEAFLNNGSIDGSQLQEHWFPQIEADIFLSHSHKDMDLAIGLAAWLKQEFSLNLFIDSCIWGYSDDLLKQLDERYCLNPGGETYSYQKRNGSTSHVHMMLNTALSKMIDQAECLFFLNTPNSITSKSAIEKTHSPWIYSEIAISEVVRRKSPARLRTKIAKLLEGEVFRGSLDIEYSLDLRSMKDIEIETLKGWSSLFKKNQNKHPLDCLYHIKGEGDLS